MKSTSNRASPKQIFLFILINALTLFSVFAFKMSGTIMEEHTDVQLPFSYIYINSGQKHFITDDEGNFKIQCNCEVYRITFRSFNYRSKTIMVSFQDSANAKIHLRQKALFVFLRKTRPKARQLIKKVLENGKRNRPHSYRPYEYETYNKFYITTDKIDFAKNKIKKLLKKFSLNLKDFNPNHHLLLTESVTERTYYNRVSEMELVTGSKVSGITKPSLFTVSPQFHPFSLYQNHINIAGTEYVSPLSKNSWKRHHFQILDTIPLEQDTVILVKFNSRINRRFDGVRGLMFISTKYYGIRYSMLTPTIERGLDVKVFKTNEIIKDSIWFPKYIKTVGRIENMGSDKVNFEAIAKTYIDKVQLKANICKKDFTEIVYEFHPDLDHNDTTIIQHRTIPLTQKDSNTYAFYDTVGVMKNFERVLNFSERVYFKEIPWKFLSFDSKKIAALNEYEGLRLGLGANTNEKFSKWLQLGSHFGYGFKDKAFKWGSQLQLIIDRRHGLNVYGKYQDEVMEAGRTNFSYDKYMFGSEGARMLRVRFMDKTEEFEAGMNFQLFEYVKSNLSFVRSDNEVPYAYTFNGDKRPNYVFTEFRAGFKYWYGEKYIRLHHDKISLGGKYPRLWVQFSQGFKDVWGGSYEYQKWDAKLEINKPFLGLGVAQIQIVGGLVNANLPYYKLYNGRGSKEVGAVAHNSFETMSYNEFLSNQYIYIFYTQYFGKLNFIRFKDYRPKVEMLHAFGIGTLSSRNSHHFDKIDIKTMEKGYFESGISINNLIMFKTPPVRSGFGVAFFYRYGPYASSKFVNNARLKISVNFRI